MSKYLDQSEMVRRREHLRQEGKRVIFTNGCFDIIHPGHVRYLSQARALGDVLIVAINSDRSVKRLKGPGRPVMSEQERAEVLSALEMVDFVTIFDEETPLELISTLLPDVLVKGGDWPIEQIVGREVVEAAGGRVISLTYEDGLSTSELIRRIVASARER